MNPVFAVLRRCCRNTIANQGRPRISAGHTRRRRRLLWILPLLACPAASAAVPPATIEVLPRFATTRDALVLVVRGNPELCWPVGVTWAAPRREGQRLILAATTPPGPQPPFCNTILEPREFVLAPLPLGFYSAEFRLDDQLRGAEAFEVKSPTDFLELQTRRFSLTTEWTDRATGQLQSAQAVQLTDESGYFWFFSPGNVELTVKVLDGRALNGAYWVFVASLTDVAYTLRVTDTTIVCILPGCNEKTYSGPAGRNQNFIDVEAFPR
jgi:hypothetical protein